MTRLVVVTVLVLTQTAAVAAVDLSRVTKDEIAQLKREHFWFGCTVEQAKATWLGVHAVAIRAVGNGGEPVLTLVPPRFDAARPFVVQTHFHGDFTSAGGPGGVHTQRIREVLDDEPQRVWVLPEAQGNIGKKKTDWENVADHGQLVHEALASVGLRARDDTRLVVSAHSAGARALERVVRNHTLRAEQLVLLDCLYERSEGPGPNTALLSAVSSGALEAVQEIVIVPAGTYPAERDEALLKAAGGRARLERVKKTPGLSDHAAAARNHLVLPLPHRGEG